MPVVLALLYSAALLVALCRGDPKRRRAARLHGTGQHTATRRAIVAALCMPGLIFALRGDPAAFMIWLGGCGALGWAITLLHRQRAER